MSNAAEMRRLVLSTRRHAVPDAIRPACSEREWGSAAHASNEHGVRRFRKPNACRNCAQNVTDRPSFVFNETSALQESEQCGGAMRDLS